MSEESKSQARVQILEMGRQSSDPDIAAIIDHAWWFWARPDQLLPPGNWFKLLVCCGRAWGKTRFGAEAVIQRAMDEPGTVIAVIGRSLRAVRRIMIENPKSGLLVRSPPWFKATYHKTDNEVRWPNGSKALIFCSEEPEPIRGNEFSFAWLDELCAWVNIKEVWHILIPAMRLGNNPQLIITTTPKNQPLIKELDKDPAVVKIRRPTSDNEKNLSARFKDELHREYAGTRLGRQELEAEILDDIEGAMWSGAQIEAGRVSPGEKPPIVRVVVGVDPAITSSQHSDKTGIVVVGLGSDGHLYVLADYTMRGTPNQWATAIFEAIAAWHADAVIVETNRGGEVIQTLLRFHAEANGQQLPRIVELNSQEGKVGRAEPIAALYEQQPARVHHVGTFGELEDQMTTWEPFPMSESGEKKPIQKSPNNIDALVFACAELKPNMAAYSPGEMITPKPVDNNLAQKVAQRQSLRTDRSKPDRPAHRSRWR